MTGANGVGPVELPAAFVPAATARLAETRADAERATALAEHGRVQARIGALTTEYADKYRSGLAEANASYGRVTEAVSRLDITGAEFHIDEETGEFVATMHSTNAGTRNGTELPLAVGLRIGTRTEYKSIEAMRDGVQGHITESSVTEEHEWAAFDREDALERDVKSSEARHEALDRRREGRWAINPARVLDRMRASKVATESRLMRTELDRLREANGTLEDQIEARAAERREQAWRDYVVTSFGDAELISSVQATIGTQFKTPDGHIQTISDTTVLRQPPEQFLRPRMRMPDEFGVLSDGPADRAKAVTDKVIRERLARDYAAAPRFYDFEMPTRMAAGAGFILGLLGAFPERPVVADEAVVVDGADAEVVADDTVPANAVLPHQPGPGEVADAERPTRTQAVGANRR